MAHIHQGSGVTMGKTKQSRYDWAKPWKRLASQLYWMLECEQHVHKEAVASYNAMKRARDNLQAQLAQKDAKLDKLQSTVDTMLTILMAPNEASRTNTISKIKKRMNPSPLLTSIRKANKDE